MAAVLKFSCLSLLLLALSAGIITNALQDCRLSDLTILQAPTGAKIQSKPEFKLTIFNACICTQTQVKLSCTGFHSIGKIDPAVLSQNGGVCLVNDGRPIYYGVNYGNFTFTYAADSQFPFKPISSEISCS